MIKVNKDEAPRGEGQETCALCFTPTRYWYDPRDVAVCPECAKTASVADVPTKRDWLVSVGDVLPDDFACAADKKRRKKVPPSNLPRVEISQARAKIYASSAGVDQIADNLMKKAAEVRELAKVERWRKAPKWANVLIGPLPDSDIDPGDYYWGELEGTTNRVFFQAEFKGKSVTLVDGQYQGYAIIEHKPAVNAKYPRR